MASSPLFQATFITMFKGVLEPILSSSVLGRAEKKGLIKTNIVSLLHELNNDHHKLDDTPYGGGPGELMRVDVVAPIIDKALTEHPMRDRTKKRIILLDPSGQVFNQACAKRLSTYEELIFVAGRFEGIDARIHHYVDEAISLGDFVLSNGDIAALAIFDATARLIPGVLGNFESIKEESHNQGRLEASLYTRPASYEGHDVPSVLKNGNHEAIARFKKRESAQKTTVLRPDLLMNYPLSEEEKTLLKSDESQSYPWQVIHNASR